MADLKNFVAVSDAVAALLVLVADLQKRIEELENA